MDPEKAKKIGLFKFSVIAPLVNGTFAEPTKEEFFRNICSNSFDTPTGKQNFSPAAVKTWYWDYRKHGLDALIPKTRDDAGISRSLSITATDYIKDAKAKYPNLSAKAVYSKLIEEGIITKTDTSVSSVARYIKDNNIKRQQLQPIERKAFEMEFANDCWQSDTTHGPYINVNGKKKKAYLIMFLDDASRLIPHGEFFFEDNGINLQKVFKKAISKRGVPKRLFVDNGKPYVNEQLKLICASLGVHLINTRPYSPESKRENRESIWHY